MTVKGNTLLLVSMGSPMQRTDGKGYTGPRDVVPANATVILEYRLIEDFEGQSTWALGLDTQRNIKVSVFDNPPRLIVDIQSGARCALSPRSCGRPATRSRRRGPSRRARTPRGSGAAHRRGRTRRPHR